MSEAIFSESLFVGELPFFHALHIHSSWNIRLAWDILQIRSTDADAAAATAAATTFFHALHVHSSWNIRLARDILQIAAAVNAAATTNTTAITTSTASASAAAAACSACPPHRRHSSSLQALHAGRSDLKIVAIHGRRLDFKDV